MARKKIVTTKKPSKKLAKKDTSHLQEITRKLLHSLDDIIERLKNVDDDEIEVLQKTHDLLFGSKVSVAGNLVILADLLIKLDESPENSDEDIAEKTTIPFSENDIALVEAFIKKLDNPAKDIGGK